MALFDRDPKRAPTGSSRTSLATERYDRAAVVSVAVFLCVAPQLVGGALPTTLAWVTGLALITALIAATTARDRNGAAPPLAWMMLLALAWTALQALPLPCAWIRVLEPDAVRGLERALRLLRADPPALCTLSRDPAATEAEVVKGFAIASAFLSGLLLSLRGQRRAVFRSVAVSGLLMALAAMVHTAIEADSLFGVYRPIYVRDAPTFAPLLNPNTLGGFLAMCVPVAIGLALSEENRTLRVQFALGSGVIAACVLMTRSRGAVGALLLGLTVFLLLAWRHRRSKRGARGMSVEVAAIGATVFVLLGLASAAWHDEVLAEFRDGEWGKLQLIFAAFGLAADHPWNGVGRGAFASAFAAAHATPHRFDHAENFVAQWCADWGFPVAGALLMATLHAVGRRVLGRSSLASAGAIAGICAIAVHNLVDLGFELAGVACVASSLLGAAVGSTRARTAASRVSCARLAIATCIAGALALAVVGPTLARDDTDGLLRDLRTNLERGDRARFRTQLAHAVRRHPGRAEFAVLGATEALTHRDDAAGRWINRGMQLAPGWTAPHVQALHWLWSEGRPAQALLELRMAAQRNVHSVGPMLCVIARHDPAGVAGAAPAGPEGALFLEMASRCFDAGSADAAAIDDELERRFPERPWAALRKIEHLLAQGNAAAALTEARGLLRRAPRLDDAALMEARALFALGQHRDALGALRRAEAWATRPAPFLALEARTHAALREEAPMREALERLRGSGGGRIAALRDALMLEGELERELGNLGRALRSFEEAHRITGDIDALANAAMLADRLGDARRALDAYSRLCDLDPGRGACISRDAIRRNLAK